MYLVFDQSCYSLGTCEFHASGQDILKRRFIFVGMFAFSILLRSRSRPPGWVRRLKKNWMRLHRLVYVAAVAGIVHFIWIQKSDIRVPFRYGFWLLVLFVIRVGLTVQKRRAARSEARNSLIGFGFRASFGLPVRASVRPAHPGNGPLGTILWSGGRIAG